MREKEENEQDFTQILMDADIGDKAARNRLWAEIYEELRLIAHRELQGEREDHTLVTSDLVNEAYLRLVDQTRITWRNRAHFYALSCKIMRRILIDHARKYQAEKRIAPKDQVPLDEALQMSKERSDRLLDLDEAVKRLSEKDPLLGKVIEYKFYGGLTTKETAEIMDTPIRTVERLWKRARAYLYQALSEQA